MGREPPKPAVEGSPPHTLGQMANIKVPGYDNQTSLVGTKGLRAGTFLMGDYEYIMDWLLMLVARDLFLIILFTVITNICAF